MCAQASMPRVLMHCNMDKFNIKFYGKFIVNSRISLVFEMLDISLLDYLLDLEGPVRLQDVSTVIQQVRNQLEPRSFETS